MDHTYQTTAGPLRPHHYDATCLKLGKRHRITKNISNFRCGTNLKMSQVLLITLLLILTCCSTIGNSLSISENSNTDNSHLQFFTKGEQEQHQNEVDQQQLFQHHGSSRRGFTGTGGSAIASRGIDAEQLAVIQQHDTASSSTGMTGKHKKDNRDLSTLSAVPLVATESPTMSPTATPTEAPTATPTEQPTYKERHSHEVEHIRKANNAAIVMVVFAVILFGGFFVTVRRCLNEIFGKHHVVSANLAFDDLSSESGSGGKGDKIDNETKVKPSSQKSESNVNGEGSGRGSITDYCTKIYSLLTTGSNNSGKGSPNRKAHKYKVVATTASATDESIVGTNQHHGSGGTAASMAESNRVIESNQSSAKEEYAAPVVPMDEEIGGASGKVRR